MSKGKKKELYIVIFLLMMSLISMLVDLDLIVPLKTINISEDRINEIMLYIFSVQASVAILGIALLALLSEGSKEKKYGIYISDYIMNKRPYIFKHKYIIIFQLCLILFGYLFLLFEWLNLLVASLVISITLTISMTFSIFDLFIDRKKIHKNIKNYCIYHFDCPPTNKLLENKIQILEGLNNELISLSNENKILQLQESFSLYVEIFKILISKNSEEDILLFEKYFANGSKALLLTQDSNVISEVLKNIIQLYQLHNNAENNKIDKLRLFYEIDEHIYKSLSSVNERVLLDENILLYLHKGIYLNEKNASQRNKSDENIVSRYANNVYFHLLMDNIITEKNQNSEFVIYMKKRLYQTIFFHKIENEMQLNEVLNYTKLLIDKSEINVLEETLIKNIRDNREDTKYNLTYFFKVMIYFYYIIEKENISDAYFIEIKENISTLIHNNRTIISEYLEEIDSTDFDFLQLITDIDTSSFSWEYFPDNGEAKWMMYSSVCKEFIVFYILSKNWDKDKITSELEKIINNNSFSYYNSYLGNNKIKTKESYRKFCQNFYYNHSLHGDENMLEEKIEILQSALNDIYRNQIIEKGNQISTTIGDENNFRQHITEKVKAGLSHIMSPFEKNMSDYKSSKDVVIYRENIRLDLLNEYTEIDTYAISSFVTKLIDVIRESLLIDSVKRDDNTMLDIFLNLIENLGFQVDTLIGYRDFFFNFNKENEFNNFEMGIQHKIKFKGGQNLLFALDHSKLFLDVCNLDISLNNPNTEEILNKLDKNDEGQFLFHETNDIFLPFEKEQLINHLNKTQRELVIAIDFNYKTLGDKIGVVLDTNKR